MGSKGGAQPEAFRASLTLEAMYHLEREHMVDGKHTVPGSSVALLIAEHYLGPWTAILGRLWSPKRPPPDPPLKHQALRRPRMWPRASKQLWSRA